MGGNIAPTELVVLGISQQNCIVKIFELQFFSGVRVVNPGKLGFGFVW